jgi:hypothetical protein
MRTHNLWERVLFFPQYPAALKERLAPDVTVAVIGASDGKSVLPLAAAGYCVITIERDDLALHGGTVHHTGDSEVTSMGLIERLKLEELHARVQVVEEDLLSDEPF